MNVTYCKSPRCRAQIVYLRNARGTVTPTDVDTLGMTFEEIEESDQIEFDASAGHVSHFKTCPDANMFNRRKPT